MYVSFIAKHGTAVRYCVFVSSSVPSAPVDFVNVSRTATSLSFSWNSPADVNGILQDYKVTVCACWESCLRLSCSVNVLIDLIDLDVSYVCFVSFYSVIIIVSVSEINLCSTVCCSISTALVSCVL